MHDRVEAVASITLEQADSYEENGHLILPGLLTSSQIATIKAIHAHATTVASPPEYSPLPVDDWDWNLNIDSQPALRKVSAPFDKFPEFRAIFTCSAVLDAVADLIGPDIYFHSSKLMCKPPLIGRRKPWHQDLAYWVDIDSRQVTLWCAIDAADRDNGCVQLIPGSHRRGLIQHEQIDDWQVREDNIPNDPVIYAEMQPGDVLFLHPLILHSSDPNHSAKPRVAALVNYTSTPRKADQKSPYGSDAPLR